MKKIYIIASLALAIVFVLGTQFAGATVRGIPYTFLGGAFWDDNEVVRFVDKEARVTCYTFNGTQGRGGLSCVNTGSSTPNQ